MRPTAPCRPSHKEYRPAATTGGWRRQKRLRGRPFSWSGLTRGLRPWPSGRCREHARGAVRRCSRGCPSAVARERRARPGTSYPVRARTRVPTQPAENGVTEEPDLQRVDPRDAFARDVRSKLTSPHRLVESGQGLGPPEVGARSSCSAETFARASARWSVAPLSMTKRATPTLSLRLRPGVSLAAWLPGTHR